MTVIVDGKSYSEHGETMPNGATACGARTRAGTPCQGRAMGNGRCRMHSGGALAGRMHPGYKNGRYTRSLPGRMQEQFWAAAQDPDLLSTREDVALITARINELLGALDSGESGKRWRELERARQKLSAARERGDTPRIALYQEELEAAVAAGHADVETWREIAQLTDQRARLTETERRRLEKAGQYIPVETAMALVGQLVDIVQRHVPDRSIQRRISEELTRVTSPKFSE